MTIEENTPILVVVTSGSYGCFGNDSLWHRYLTDFLMYELGGVNMSVPSGEYHFNVEVLDETNVVATLTPVE